MKEMMPKHMKTMPRHDPFAYGKKHYLAGEGGEMVNPAKSEPQRKLFGAALSMRRGKMKPKGGAGKIARTVSEGTISEFARRPKKGY